jgi:hypothetical protein
MSNFEIRAVIAPFFDDPESFNIVKLFTVDDSLSEFVDKYVDSQTLFVSLPGLCELQHYVQEGYAIVSAQLVSTIDSEYCDANEFIIQNNDNEEFEIAQIELDIARTELELGVEKLRSFLAKYDIPFNGLSIEAE